MATVNKPAQQSNAGTYSQLGSVGGTAAGTVLGGPVGGALGGVAGGMLGGQAGSKPVVGDTPNAASQVLAPKPTAEDPQMQVQAMQRRLQELEAQRKAVTGGQ